MHISDKVSQELENHGWEKVVNGDASRKFTKRFYSVNEAGVFSDGSRILTITINDTGRWLELFSGECIGCVDLRNHSDAESALIALRKDS